MYKEMHENCTCVKKICNNHAQNAKNNAITLLERQNTAVWLPCKTCTKICMKSIHEAKTYVIIMHKICDNHACDSCVQYAKWYIKTMIKMQKDMW